MRKIIPLTILLLAFSAVCYSFYKNKVTVTVEGTVKTNGQPVPGAIVQLLHKDSKADQPHTAPTAADGSYTIQVTTYEHEEVTLIVQEEGFERIEEKIYPDSDIPKEYKEFKLKPSILFQPVANKQ